MNNLLTIEQIIKTKSFFGETGRLIFKKNPSYQYIYKYRGLTPIYNIKKNLYLYKRFFNFISTLTFANKSPQFMIICHHNEQIFFKKISKNFYCTILSTQHFSGALSNFKVWQKTHLTLFTNYRYNRLPDFIIFTTINTPLIKEAEKLKIPMFSFLTSQNMIKNNILYPAFTNLSIIKIFALQIYHICNLFCKPTQIFFEKIKLSKITKFGIYQKIIILKFLGLRWAFIILSYALRNDLIKISQIFFEGFFFFFNNYFKIYKTITFSNKDLYKKYLNQFYKIYKNMMFFNKSRTYNYKKYLNEIYLLKKICQYNTIQIRLKPKIVLRAGLKNINKMTWKGKKNTKINKFSTHAIHRWWQFPQQRTKFKYA